MLFSSVTYALSEKPMGLFVLGCMVLAGGMIKLVINGREK